MKHAHKERIKSIILITLFLTSLIQVGILWSKQSHRLPISFLAGLFSKPAIEVSDEMTRNELFVPFRLIMSNGDDTHWVVKRDDPLHEILWNEAKAYLAAIADGNISEAAMDSERPDPEKWAEITSRRGFVAEFKAGMSSDLVKWFLNKLNSSIDLPTIQKLMIIPEGGIRTGISTLYIYDAAGRVHRYEARTSTLPKSFAEILQPFEEPGQTNYRKFITMYESNLHKTLNVVPDALYAVGDPPGWTYRTLTCAVPADIGDADRVREALLGIQKDRFDKKEYENGTIQVSITGQLYKTHPDGFFQYVNSSEAESGAGEKAGAALLNAYSLVRKAVSLADTGADIYLSDMRYFNGVYNFTFDYMVDSLPVYIDYTTATGDRINSAFTVRADSRKVLSCTGIIRNFNPDGKNKYDDRLIELLSRSNLDRSGLDIRDISVGYILNSDEANELPPSMVLENRGTPSLITLRLPVRKGD